MNREELIAGFIHGAFIYSIMDWWLALLCGVICSILWAIGGSQKKIVRRLGVPVVVGVVSLNPFFIPAGFGILSIGYGIPSRNDKGSFLGKIVHRFLRDEKQATIVTRVILLVLYMTAFLITYCLKRG